MQDNLKYGRFAGAVLIPLVGLGTLMASQPIAAKKTTIRWIAGIYNPERLKMCQEMVAVFNKKNPDIEVKFEPKGDILGDLLTRSAAGVAPDVVWGWGDQYWPLVERNMLYDLTPNFQREIDLNDFIPVTLEGAKYKGKIYSVDGRSTSSFTAYNLDHFAKAGISTPTELSAKGQWNFNTYLDAARKMTQDNNGDGKIDIWGTAVRYGATSYLTRILSEGGTMFSADRTKCTINDPKSIDAISFMRDLVYRYKVSADILTTADWSGFQKGKTGMIELGAWDFGLMRANKQLSWDVALNPKGSAGLVNCFTPGGSYWIMRSTKHPREAWRFVKWLYSEEGEQIVIKWGEVPMTKPGMTSKAYLNHPSGYPKNAIVVYDSMKYAKPFYYPPSWPRVNEALEANLRKVWLNKTTPKEGCEGAVRDVNKILSEKKK